MQRKIWNLVPAIATVLALGAVPAAENLLITPKGVEDAKGDIGCALFTAPDGFPMDSQKARAQWLKAGTAQCCFADLTPCKYAVAVSVDANGNRKTDPNFVGMPTAAWGVSNNASPKLRAPRFEEAAFTVAPGPETRIKIQVVK